MDYLIIVIKINFKKTTNSEFNKTFTNRINSNPKSVRIFSHTYEVMTLKTELCDFFVCISGQT